MAKVEHAHQHVRAGRPDDGADGVILPAIDGGEQTKFVADLQMAGLAEFIGYNDLPWLFHFLGGVGHRSGLLSLRQRRAVIIAKIELDHFQRQRGVDREKHRSDVLPGHH